MALAFAPAPAPALATRPLPPGWEWRGSVPVQRVLDFESGLEVLAGEYQVWEDREAADGRRISLHFVIVPSAVGEPEPDPVVILGGGPGQAATTLVASTATMVAREHREILLLDQRGTGRSNPLHCGFARDASDPQSLLELSWDLESIRACRAELEKHADLSLYSTPIAADDLDELCAALGYDKINLRGGSYGSRAALVFLRSHPERVRTATLIGVAPIAFTNPLFHARGAQDTIDLLFADCAADPGCRKVLGDLRGQFETVLARLEKEPARIEVDNPSGKGLVEVVLTRNGFAEGIRTLMYSLPTQRQVPWLIHRAFEYDYQTVAEACMRSNGGIRRQLAWGMLLSVTCAEDVARIDPDNIGSVTDGTFLGDVRVRGQMSACAEWPLGRLPEGYGNDVVSDVPVLLFSGTHDPVTPPRWGAQAVENLKHALHVVVPAAHGVGGDCVDSLERAFLATGSVAGLDASCVATMRLPRLVLPHAAAGKGD
ncbi:MAG TPA: alpha/beta fold hydrolase [Planctomycetota bacterium]